MFKAGNLLFFKPFICFSDLDTYPVNTFHQQMADNITQVEFKGCISDTYFTALKDCLQNSNMVKNKYKRIL